jgi:hypothetical protein
MLVCALVFCVPQTVSAKTVSAKLGADKVKVGKQITVSASTKNVTYSSSDSTIAYVNQDGVITGKKAGTVTIRVKRDGYTTKELKLTVEKVSRKPTLPVTVDEAKLVNTKLVQKKDGNYTFSAQIKNKAKSGTIKKIIYTYEVKTLVSTTTEDTTQADQTTTPEDTTGDDAATPEETTGTDAAATPEDTTSTEYTASAEAAKPVYKTKKVTLTAKNIKAGATSKKVSCTGDASGKVDSMKLVKVELYTGKALYVYNAKKNTGTLKWGVADTTAPVFSGWIEDQSSYNGCVLRVCYTDRKKTYDFKDHIKVVDDRDKTVTIKVDTSAINWKKEGVYKVKYTATDKAGNVAKTWAKVQVYKKGEAEELADDVLASITKSSWSDEKKLRAIYSYTKSHCSYVHTGAHTDWRKVAVNGITRYSGDCFTFYSISRLLITRAGIPNIMIRRYPAVEGRNHWWNLVYVDGGWYHFDSCPRSRDGYFCLQTDAQLRLYSTDYTFKFDESLYPERATKVISRNPV